MRLRNGDINSVRWHEDSEEDEEYDEHSQLLADAMRDNLLSSTAKT